MKKLISKVVTVATFKGEDSNSINVLTGTSFILPLNLYKDIIISIINCFLPFNLQFTIFKGNYPLNRGLFFFFFFLKKSFTQIYTISCS